MDLTLFTDCPTCHAPMDSPCVWDEPLPHPVYHPQRTIAAHLADAPNVVETMPTGAVGMAFQRAIDEMA